MIACTHVALALHLKLKLWENFGDRLHIVVTHVWGLCGGGKRLYAYIYGLSGCTSVVSL
jgi:hypothetical protein